MSKGILTNDICFSTVKGMIGNAFNTDGKERDHIDIEEARTAFTFDLEKHQSCTEDGRPLPKQWHLRRTDDDAIVPTRGLGDEFQPVQHSQLFEYVIKDLMPQLPTMELETVGTLHGGATGIITAKFGDGFMINGDKSPQQTRLFITNPNGRSSVKVGFTTVRLFCQNQIEAASKEAGKNGFKVYHTTNADIRVDHAIDTIYNSLGAVRHLQHREERLASIAATEQNLIHLLNKFFPLNRFEEGSRGWTRLNNQRTAILNQWRDGETAQSFETDSAWKLYNAFSYGIYNPIRIGKETDLAQITYAGTDGSRADRAKEIFKAVEEEVGIAA